MKKLLKIVLPFYPFLIFGQNITYEDLMQIENSMQFERVVIENNYENYQNYKKGEWGDHLIEYGYELEKNYENKYVASSFAGYNKNNNRWWFQFHKNNPSSTSNYNYIFEKVKRRCSFVSVLDGGYARYKCPDSKYKGNIKFNKGSTWNTISMGID